MANVIQLRRGTAAAWAAANTVLAAGEMGTETDTGRFKIGDGTTGWNALPYASGNQGSAIVPIDMNFDMDDSRVWGMPVDSPGRSALTPDAKNWSFLGTATAAAVTVGPIIWFGQFKQLMIKYFIAGYNGGTPVGRLLLGSASISTTALTNGSNLSENSAAPTGAPSIPGMPMAVTLSNISREGWAFVDGASGSLKNINVVGQNNGTVAAPPTIFHAAGVFSDLGTNLLLQRAQLTVYDTLVAVAASAQTFTAGTYLSVWGRNND